MTLGNVLREAAAAAALRQRVGELEAQLAQQKSQMEAEAQERDAAMAASAAALEEERKLHESAKSALLRHSTASLVNRASPRHAFFYPAHFLDAKDVASLGNGCSGLYALAQEDALWRSMYLRRFPSSSTKYCTNYRAKMYQRQALAQRCLAACWWQRTLDGDKQRTLIDLTLESSEAELRWCQAKLRERDIDIAGLQKCFVRWTLPRQSLQRTRPGRCMSSPKFVARGQRGHLDFYPRGVHTGGGAASSSFYIAFDNPRGLSMSANVWVGDNDCWTLDHTWGEHATHQSFGWADAGPSFGNDSPLTIVVEFLKLSRGSAKEICCI